MTDLTCTVSRIIKAPIEDVFNAWLDPEMLAKFMTPDQGVSVPKAETDPREGGRFDIIMKTPDNELPHGGIYKKINRHSQIIFTWESAFSIEGSTVTLDFSAVEGGTHIELTHVKFRDEQMRNNHAGGWAAILVALDETLS